MKTVIVLVMHGVPPNDFPRQELAEYFSLGGRLERQPASITPEITARYNLLHKKLLEWPRNLGNDPFYTASQELAQQLSQKTGCEVLTGFNEFCAPNVIEALERAVNSGATKIAVVTPMMTRGGAHAEKEIPALIKRFQEQHPEIQMVYAWPFDSGDVAQFLSEHLRRFITLP